MENEKIIFWRNFLLRIFLGGIVLMIIMIMLTSCMWDWWSVIVIRNMHIEEKELGKILASTFLYLRLVLVFGVLIPAIALHTMIKK